MSRLLTPSLCSSVRRNDLKNIKKCLCSKMCITCKRSQNQRRHKFVQIKIKLGWVTLAVNQIQQDIHHPPRIQYERIAPLYPVLAPNLPGLRLDHCGSCREQWILWGLFRTFDWFPVPSYPSHPGRNCSWEEGSQGEQDSASETQKINKLVKCRVHVKTTIPSLAITMLLKFVRQRNHKIRYDQLNIKEYQLQGV